MCVEVVLGKPRVSGHPTSDGLGLRASWPGTPQGPVTAYTEKAPRAKAWSLVRFGALLAFLKKYLFS